MNNIKLVLIDFGGVIAEEGFKKGVTDLADKFGLDREFVKKTGFDTVYDCGFTKGSTDADGFWDMFKEKTGIKMENNELTEFILERFIVRDEILSFVKMVKKKNIKISILSDQTNWLDLLNEKYDFFNLFERVFNSYHLGMTKKELEFFEFALKEMDEKPENTLFIDDHNPHIKRAEGMGLNAVLFKDPDDFRIKIKKYFTEEY